MVIYYKPLWIPDNIEVIQNAILYTYFIDFIKNSLQIFSKKKNLQRFHNLYATFMT